MMVYFKGQQNAIKIIQDLIEPLIPDEYEYSIRLNKLVNLFKRSNITSFLNVSFIIIQLPEL